jgi:trimeric autotransporter adhesin
VTVTFDKIAAPIIFASFNAVLVQVPNDLAGRSATSIVVSYQNVSSSMVAKVVVAASPGLYTRGGAGVGLLSALNPDGTRNSPANAVARGSYVVVYANGLGQINPPVPTGQRAPFNLLSQAAFPITASIGGQPAQVLYAGLAPGFVGLFQLNIAVPANASTGVVPLTITINGVPSQDNVFIAVR